MSVGPAALDSMLVAAFLLSLKLTTLADYIQSAILLTFLVGIIQFLLGLLKMGFIIQFLSKPVISGFTNAAVLLIGASQLAPLLGLASLRMPAEQLSNSFGVIAITTAIGISALLALALAKRYAPKIPIALLVVLLATVASAYFNWNEIGVREIGRIPSGLPSLSLHVFDVLLIRDLLPFAAALAILGFLSSMTIIKASLYGGIIFGLGWALTGACPGPIYVLIGAGYLPLLVVFVFALLGTYCYGLLKPRLPH